MDRQCRNIVKRTLRASRSRRQVLTTVSRGTIGGVGAALIGHGLGGNAVLDRALTPGANAEEASCSPPADVHERLEISKLDDPQFASQLESLRRGVAEMKWRSVVNRDDPTGWLFQANLHGRPGILVPDPVWCQHSSWFFLPWHRMYLYWFERILRDAAGDPTLRLPYWNYLDDPAKRTLPRALRDEFDPPDTRNPLYEERRAPGINNGSLSLSPTAVTYEGILDIIPFFPPKENVPSFGGVFQNGPDTSGDGAGSLETGPHNNVHMEVGGLAGRRVFQLPGPGVINYHCSLHPAETGSITIVDDPALPDRADIQIADCGFVPAAVKVQVGATLSWMNEGDTRHTVALDDLPLAIGPIRPNGHMALASSSPRDPVFWMHHANLDRVWERWLAKGGDRRNPTDQPAWMDQVFTFYDEHGEAQSKMVKEFLDIKCLGYRYDDPLTEYEPDEPSDGEATPIAIAPAIEARTLGESPAAAPIVISAEPVTTAVELAPPAEEALTGIAARAATPVADARAPSLSLTLEGIENIAAPSITFAVYVNLPPDSEPDPASDSFVGTLYLFATFLHDEHEGGGQGLRQTFDITRAVQASEARGDAPGGVTVTIVPVGADRELARLATPVAEAAQPFVDAARGPWVSIARMTVTAIE